MRILPKRFAVRLQKLTSDCKRPATTPETLWPVELEAIADYDATGAAWSAGPAVIYNRLAEKLCEPLGPDLTGRSVIDLGSGTGAASAALGRRGAAVVALDAALGMLRARVDRTVPAVSGDLMKLPLRTRSVDAAVAAFSLNHLTDPLPAMHEIERVVRCGGMVLASAYGVEDVHPVRAAVATAAASLGHRPPGWESYMKDLANPHLATVDSAREVTGRLGAVADVREIVVRFDDLTARDLVQWRLGMAQFAPFVASLDAESRSSLVADAIARLGPDWPPLVRRMVVISWLVSGDHS